MSNDLHTFWGKAIYTEIYTIVKAIQKPTTSTHPQHEKAGSCGFTQQSSTVLRALRVSPLAIPHAHSGRQCCDYSHFTVEEAEAQRGYATWPKLHAKSEVAEPRCGLRCAWTPPPPWPHFPPSPPAKLPAPPGSFLSWSHWHC